MKPFYAWLSLFLTSFLACQPEQEPTSPVVLPLSIQEGYGPFYTGFGLLQGEDIAPQALSGIPSGWTNVSQQRIEFDIKQFIYQSYHAGTVSLEQYKNLRESWQWTPDATKLSKTPIRCYVYTVRGYDVARGKWSVLIDTNNNLDMGDEDVLYPEVIHWQDPLAYRDSRLVTYEVYRQGRVVREQIPVVVKTYGTDFIYNCPIHAQAKLQLGGRTYTLAVGSAPDFESPEIVEAPSWLGPDKPAAEDLVKLNENITLGGVTFKNRGVDLYHNVLRLERVDPSLPEYSLQRGYPMKPFRATEFTSGRSLALADYRGKYVYLDFWGTWCRGCVEDMPSLKGLYHRVDKSRVEFIGIAVDTPERLSGYLAKHRVNWPQVRSDSVNRLVEQYGVTGFPTTILLDPKGIVVGRDLRTEALAKKLVELGVMPPGK